MKLKQDKTDKNIYLVESSSRKGKFYKLNAGNNTCDCPGFRFHRGHCKHLDALKAHLAQKAGKGSQEVIEYLKQKGNVDSVELINKFGESLVNELINRGELIERYGKISLLE